MKKILLVYPGFIVREVPLNLLYISAVLRQAGYDTKVFELTKYLRKSSFFNPLKRILNDLSDLIDYYQPDSVGFSVMTMGYNLTKEMARLVKHKEIRVIYGGFHPTVSPEETIAESFVDFICVGEGDHSSVNFFNRYFAGEDYTGVRGIWSKDEKGNICRNEIDDLIIDLDTIPFPDRDALPSHYYNAELTGANVLTSRGCPYSCSFCQNRFLKNIYKGRGPFVRYRSTENVLNEIEQLITRYGTSCLYFSDEAFTLNRKKTLDFLSGYKKRFKNLPFMCQTRADLLNEEIMESLKEAGCHQINIGVESGNECIRNRILRKGLSNEQIRNAFSLAKRYGIRTQSFNMIGVPGETRENIFETINFNKELEPSRMPCTIFMPFHGTDLGEEYLKNHMTITDAKDCSIYYSQLIIKHEHLSSRQLIGYQGFFDWYITLPKKWYFLVDFLRIIYQTLVPPVPFKNPALNYFREKIIEMVYQSKRLILKDPVKNR